MDKSNFHSFELVKKVFLNFVTDRNVIRITCETSGIVNMTYRVVTDDCLYICQCLNKTIFNTNLNGMIHNYNRYKNAFEVAKNSISKWYIPQWVRTANEEYFHKDSENNNWRVYPYIDGSVHLTIRSKKEIYAFATAVSLLHNILDYFDGVPFETIKNFHNLEFYYDEYYNCVSGTQRDKFCEAVISENIDLILGVDINYCPRVIHGDTRINNVIFDKNFIPISFIDIDTFSYRSRLIDIADSIRSIADKNGDFSESEEINRLNIDAILTFVRAYRESPLYKLTSVEESLLFHAVIYMPFELGLRLYTDYLRGSIYFKSAEEQQNLRRARCQFLLFLEMRSDKFKSALQEAILGVR